ncbi:MAG: HNH endonuclease [Sandaracinaceae bacterium]|nr:HNH endonuclease [Sandaracinaceae bacterium]MDW8246329.1 HNH endonuclease [Sandaracinaceae bacterium]
MLPSQKTLIDKAASDNGFDRRLEESHSWIRFKSSILPFEVWMSAIPSGNFFLAIASEELANTLPFTPSAPPFPPPAPFVFRFNTYEELYRGVRELFERALGLLPSLRSPRPEQSASPPQRTEGERSFVPRQGQDLFRNKLIEYWEGRCAVTGLDLVEVLRASHIKPWAHADDHERLDVYNGLLLAPHLDTLFDRGFLSFDEEGLAIISPLVSAEARSILGIDKPLKIRGKYTEEHKKYMAWHRANVFRP